MKKAKNDQSKKRKPEDNKASESCVPKDEKVIFWAHEQIGDFRRPPFGGEAKEECAVLLRRLQRGENLTLPQSRPMPSVGNGCHELRVRDREANWRLVYLIDTDAIVVLHIFAKKTQATPHDVITLCKRRLKIYREKRAAIDRLKKGN